MDELKKNGVLLHISSLPSPWGIGTLGKSAYDFIDFLKMAGQSCWQILPIGPTGYGDSPYQSFSTFAGNPYFIDLDDLEQRGLLQKSEYSDIDWGEQPDKADYGRMHKHRFPVLLKASDRLLKNPPEEYEKFCRENEWWLEDYAVFMTIKLLEGQKAWTQWAPELRDREKNALERIRREHAPAVNYWKTVQYLFFSQWDRLHARAKEQGIDIIGDLPIYVAPDSVDVWAHPDLFQLDEKHIPSEVAGCPPDGFSDDGQLWGNPLFDWEYMQKDGYLWWTQRIGYLTSVYDIIRIDHFRGFDSYYAIPYGEKNAKNGRWKEGPGIALFQKVEAAIGKKRIIAEDLGFLTDSVRKLLKDSGFPGMKVLEFAFDTRDDNNNEYLPHNYPENCVAYIGTHDNETVQGWIRSADPKDIEYAVRYLKLSEPANYHWEMMEALWNTEAALTIVQAQDLLGLGSESRMNTPSTTGNNWQWRLLPGDLNRVLAEKLRKEMIRFQRTGIE